jgi:hypothetical protein
MKPVQCIMGIAIGRDNKPDQASTRRSPGAAFQRSPGSARQETAVAWDGSNRDGLYFPVNSEDAPARPATEPPAGRDAGDGDACISLLIPGTKRSGLRPNRPRDDGPERGGLYFSVNSRKDSRGAARMRALADRRRFRRRLRLLNPDRRCKVCRLLLTRTPRPSAVLRHCLFCCAK